VLEFRLRHGLSQQIQDVDDGPGTTRQRAPVELMGRDELFERGDLARDRSVARLEPARRRLGSAFRVADAGVEILLARLEERLLGWRDVLRRQVSEARQILGGLLVGRLVFTPKQDARGWSYAFTGTGSVSAMVAGIVTPEGMVTPAGFEPAISTLKGSRPWPG
jgi:hypothetical protein